MSKGALVGQGEGLIEAKLKGRIDENDAALTVGALDGLDREEGRESRIGTMTAQCGAAGESARRFAQHAGIGGFVEVAVGDSAVGDCSKRGGRDVA